MAAAKFRAIDHLRRNQLLDRKHAEIGPGAGQAAGAGFV